MHYNNHDSRLQLQDTANQPSAQKFFSLERGTRGVRLRVRNAATMARRKLTPFSLPAAAALALYLAPMPVAHAQLGYDPFASNPIRAEEKWAPYVDAATGGTNRPVSTTVSGVTPPVSNAMSFNFAVSAPSTATSGAFLTGGGNIYSFSAALTLTLTSTFAATVGSFNTVVFSIKTLGSPLNTAGVSLTLTSTGQTIAPIYTNVVDSGAGMGATAQSAFQFDLSGAGGSNNFSITVPGSASSVSFSSAQLDATTTAYGTQSVVPEPSSIAIVLTAVGGLCVAGVRSRRRG